MRALNPCGRSTAPSLPSRFCCAFPVTLDRNEFRSDYFFFAAFSRNLPDFSAAMIVSPFFSEVGRMIPPCRWTAPAPCRRAGLRENYERYGAIWQAYGAIWQMETAGRSPRGFRPGRHPSISGERSHPRPPTVAGGININGLMLRPTARAVNRVQPAWPGGMPLDPTKPCQWHP